MQAINNLFSALNRCLRYYAAFCRPARGGSFFSTPPNRPSPHCFRREKSAIANMSLRTILRCILPCTWRFVSTLQLLPTVPRRLCQSRRRKILFPLSINQTTDHTHGHARIRAALWSERVGRPLSVESGRRDTATTLHGQYVFNVFTLELNTHVNTRIHFGPPHSEYV